MSETEQKVIDRCESLGVSEVRRGLIAGDFGDHPAYPGFGVAKAWLDSKDSATRDARETETLAVAKDANTIALAAAVSASEANVIARSAKKYALIAALAAIVSAIIAIRLK